MATAVSAVDDVLSEYAGLEMQLADPELHKNWRRRIPLSKKKWHV